MINARTIPNGTPREPGQKAEPCAEDIACELALPCQRMSGMSDQVARKVPGPRGGGARVTGNRVVNRTQGDDGGGAYAATGSGDGPTGRPAYGATGLVVPDVMRSN